MKNLPWIIVVILGITCAGLLSFARTTAISLNSETTKFVDAVAQLEKARETIATLEAAAKLKPLPLKVTHRNAAVASGGVIMIENEGDQNLALTLTMKRGTETPKEFDDVIINAKTIKSVGQLEGWAFVTGDVVDFKSAGYRNAKFVYP